MQRCDNLVDIEKRCKNVFNEYLDAKIGVDTAENEPSKVLGLLADKSEKRKKKIREKLGIELFI